MEKRGQRFFVRTYRNELARSNMNISIVLKQLTSLIWQSVQYMGKRSHVQIRKDSNNVDIPQTRLTKCKNYDTFRLCWQKRENVDGKNFFFQQVGATCYSALKNAWKGYFTEQCCEMTSQVPRSNPCKLVRRISHERSVAFNTLHVSLQIYHGILKKVV